MNQARRASLGLLKEQIFSAPLLVLVSSLAVQLLSETDQSLFGQPTGFAWIEALAFSPTDPWRHHFMSLLIYPLAHANWSHWAMSALLWIYLGPQVSKYLTLTFKSRLYGILAALSFYLIVNLLVAVSFGLPWAPAFHPRDRVLGLSALIMTHLGLLIVVWPRPVIFILFAALLASFATSSAPSSLTNWGHGVGFICGIAAGLFFRRVATRTSG